MRKIWFLGLLVFVFATFGCEGSRFGAREKGALGGAALGAGLGAIVGNQTGNPGAGIAIGSAFGALSGGLIGNEIDNTNSALDERESRLSAQEREIRENQRLIDELKRRGVDVRETERGVVVNLPDVLFEFDKSNLTSDAQRTVHDIVDAVKAHTEGRRISVEGHTDSVGSISYNQRLSEDRAWSVARSLHREGIPKPSIQVRGFGERNPIASNSSAAGRQRNRRVEVVIEH